MLRALVICALVAAVTAAEAPWLGPGPHGHRELDLRLVDAARGRPVPVHIHLPVEADGPLPVLVFSHGLGGDRFVYAHIGAHLASHGYASVHPQHAGSDAEAASGGLLALAASGADPVQRQARVADLRVTLDHLAALELDGVGLDLDAIAVGGHSFGAYAALVLGGQALTLPGAEPAVAPDPRVRAVVALSPIGPGVLDLTQRSWDGLRTPTLFVTGTEDTTIGTADWRSRLTPFEQAPAAPRYLAVITGLRHHAMGDYGFAHAPVRRDPRHHPWLLALITAFLDARLRDDAAAAAWLADDGPAAMGGGELEWRQPTP